MNGSGDVTREALPQRAGGRGLAQPPPDAPGLSDSRIPSSSLSTGGRRVGEARGHPGQGTGWGWQGGRNGLPGSPGGR